MKRFVFPMILAASALTACSDNYDDHSYHRSYDGDQGSYRNDQDYYRGDRDGRDTSDSMRECWKNSGTRYWFNQMDTNRDQRISRSEFYNFNKKMFAQGDRNHDGMLSMDELRDMHTRNWQRMRQSMPQDCMSGVHRSDYSEQTNYDTGTTQDSVNENQGM